MPRRFTVAGPTARPGQHNIVQDNADGVSVQAVGRMVDQGKAVLLFDGFDELADLAPAYRPLDPATPIPGLDHLPAARCRHRRGQGHIHRSRRKKHPNRAVGSLGCTA